jgi:hypothetical protein
MPGGPVVVERGVTRVGADGLLDTILRLGGVGRVQRDPTEQERREARRDELVARGLARAARGRLYDMIQRGVCQ